SVPGLPAKDVIDVQITVADLEPATAQALAEALGAIGYRLPDNEMRDHRPPGASGPDSDWAKLYFRAPDGQRRTHTHVPAPGRPHPALPSALPRLPAGAPRHRRGLRRAEAAAGREPGQPG